MYIKELHLKNYRCYDDLTIDFNRRLTVLVGLNGRGKTAILEGVRLACSALDKEPRPLTDKDIRNVPLRKNKKIVGMELALPLEIEAGLDKCRIRRVLSRPGEADCITITGRPPEAKATPVFQYYGTDRMEYINRFMQCTLEDFQGKFPIVKKAVDYLLKPFPARVEYNKTLQTFVVWDPVEGEQLITVASDGARSMMGMVADIAMKMALANPELGPEVLHMVPGIVLIDEIDLFLHPAWQQKILGFYLKLFPKVQFIVTTHSPQVLSTVEPERIRVLGDDSNMVYVPEFSLGAESRQILQEIQHVESRAGDLPIVKALNKYLDLVGKNEYDSPEALKLREKLDAWSCGRDPVLTRVDMDIRLRRMRNK